VTRGAAFAAGVAVLVFVVSANAGPPGSIVDNQYEGRVERTPNTYLGFDVVGNGGRKRVAKVTALVRYNCVGGGGGMALGRVNGRLRIEGGRFAGTLRGRPELARASHRLGPPSTSRIKYGVQGELRSRRRARGKIDATLSFVPTKMRGSNRVRCYSGKLDWKARRGANVPVAP
jgi:hypothetical protein